MSDPRLKRIDQSKQWPPFVALIAVLLTKTTRHHAISGFRSVEEQDGLYAQGRTAPGKIVTKAKGGQSLHNFGGADDFACDGDLVAPGLQPIWTVSEYKELADAARAIPGLVSGFFWQFQDPGHVQIDLLLLFNMPEIDALGELLAVERKGGMVAVFALLDEKARAVNAHYRSLGNPDVFPLVGA